jgi:uncharacterized damage-inducible protein DinB
MSNLTSEQVTILQQVALTQLENESRTTKRVIEAIPADRSSYKPDPVAMSSLDLAKHLAISEIQILNGAINGEFTFSEKVPDSVTTPADVAKWYGDTTEKTLAKLRAMTPEQLAKVIDFRGFMQMPAVMYVSLAVSHSIHHRGQLSTHLRPMGAKVPSIYGPCYEDDQARKAAQA